VGVDRLIGLSRHVPEELAIVSGSFAPMAKTPTKIEVLQEGDERFLLMTFPDGSEERKPIVKLPRKQPRFPYRRVTFDKSRKKGF
jgi:hypothetical protein